MERKSIILHYILHSLYYKYIAHSNIKKRPKKSYYQYRPRTRVQISTYKIGGASRV